MNASLRSVQDSATLKHEWSERETDEYGTAMLAAVIKGWRIAHDVQDWSEEYTETFSDEQMGETLKFAEVRLAKIKDI